MMHVLEWSHKIAGDLNCKRLAEWHRTSSEPVEDVVVRTLALEAHITIHTVTNQFERFGSP